MATYKSSYTGPQIDQAVGNALNKDTSTLSNDVNHIPASSVVKSAIDAVAGSESASTANGNIVFRKFGKVVMAQFNSGTFLTNADNYITYGDAEITVPSGFVPAFTADFLETYGKLRIQITTTGKFYSPSSALNGEPIRGSVMYLVN